MSDRITFGGNRSWRRLAGWGLGLAVVIVVAVYAGRAIFFDSRGPARLVIYAYSTQEEVLTQSVLPAFEQAWEAETGRDLTIESVFGPSGTLAGQINLGAPADVALLSNEQHVNWLRVGRQVHWETQPALVSTTPMVIVTRPGNPLKIADYGDLARPGLRLLHADPRSSGAGTWAVLAEYGSALLESGDQAVARSQLEAIWHNVRLLAPSARATLTMFELGAGDALVTYEQDARLALARGIPLEIVLPPRTIVAQHMAVIVDANVTPAEQAAAQGFIIFLLSDPGQNALARYQLRPARFESEVLPALTHPFPIEALGGWSSAYPQLVEDLWQTEIAPRLDLEPSGQLLEGRGE